MSCKRNVSSIDEQILMKLYTVVVYDLRMCMKEYYTGFPNTSREITELTWFNRAMSFKCNFFGMYKQIWMKLDTVYNLKMCMKEILFFEIFQGR